MKAIGQDSLKTTRTLQAGGREYRYFSLPDAYKTIGDGSRPEKGSAKKSGEKGCREKSRSEKGSSEESCSEESRKESSRQKSSTQKGREKSD